MNYDYEILGFAWGLTLAIVLVALRPFGDVAYDQGMFLGVMLPLCGVVIGVTYRKTGWR